MILYHFTAFEQIESILLQGLNRGEIPITATHVENGVWFSTRDDPFGTGNGQGGRMLTPEECNRFGKPFGSRFPDKTKVRIIVDLDKEDLVYWPEYAKERGVDEKWYNTLARVAGGHAKMRTWWISLNPVPLEKFVYVSVKQDNVWIDFLPQNSKPTDVGIADAFAAGAKFSDKQLAAFAERKA